MSLYQPSSSNVSISNSIGQSVIASGTVALSALSLIEAGARLLFNVVVAAMYGLSAATDAFFLAQALPLFVSSLLLATSVNGLVPVLAGLADRGTAHQSTVFSTFLNLTCLATLILALFGIAAASGIARIIGPGMGANANEMALNLVRLLLATIVLNAGSEVVRAAFYAMRLFAPPSLGSLLRDLIATIVTVVLGSYMGIEAAAVGFMVGSIAQFLTLLTLLSIQSDLRYRMCVVWHHPDVRRSAQLALAPLIGIGSRQGAVLIEYSIATFLTAGSVAALGLAFRITNLMERLLLRSVETALLPVFSSDHASGQDQRLGHNLAYGFRLALVIGSPVAVGLLMLGTDATALVFERGSFDAQATSAVGQLLSFFALGVVFGGPARVCLSYFYATMQAKAAVVLLVSTSVLKVVMALLLVRLIGLNGFGLAYTASQAVSSVAAYAYVRRQFATTRVGTRLSFLVRIVGVSIAMATGISFVLSVAGTLQRPWGRAVSVVAAGTSGLVAYGLASRLLLPRELADLYQPVAKKGERVVRRLTSGVRVNGQRN